jgi:hypothetical protein
MKDEPGTWTVTKRPLTLNMNELAELANYPPSEFPMHNFGNAADYFKALATQQLCHLRTQRNDAFTDEADCRKKICSPLPILQNSTGYLDQIAQWRISAVL